jgi:hypothetical protein
MPIRLSQLLTPIRDRTATVDIARDVSDLPRGGGVRVRDRSPTPMTVRPVKSPQRVSFFHFLWILVVALWRVPVCRLSHGRAALGRERVY